MKTILRIFISSTLFTTISFGDIINVPADIDSIQGGIDLANVGDTVLVQPGIYVENISFNGKNIVVGSLLLTTNDSSYISKTVIDGNQNYNSVVRFQNGEDSTAVLCGFTITNGVGGRECPTFQCSTWGGGVTCKTSNPTLTDLLITGNTGYMGGGIYSAGSSPKLINVTITENTTRMRGGGIYLSSSSPKFDSVNRCNIYSNYASDGSDLYSENETLKIKVFVDTFTVSSPTDFHAYPKSNFNFDIMNAKIEQTNSDLYVNPKGNNNNSGLSWEEPLRTIYFSLVKIMADTLNPHTIYLANGNYPDDLHKGYPISLIDYVSIVGESKSGVIFSSENFEREIFSFISSKGIALANLSIIGNGGRGFYCRDSNPVMQNMTFENVSLSLFGSNPFIKDVKISNNTGRGIQLSGSSPTLINVEITNNGNWGINCGGYSHAKLINCTVSGNTSPYYDIGGIHINVGSSLGIVNSIIWNNPLYEIGIYEDGAITVTNSLIKGGKNGIHDINTGGTVYWLAGNLNTDPMFVDPTNGDYRLQTGSPFIDAGIQDIMIVYNDGRDTLFVPPMDYIGLAPDIGAYEYGDPSVIEQETIKLPKRYTLRQNFPNPFNPLTTIEFTLLRSEFTTLKVFNILGKEVATLVSNKLNQGNHTYQFDGKNLASGVYYYQLVAGDYREVKKMILLK